MKNELLAWRAIVSCFAVLPLMVVMQALLPLIPLNAPPPHARHCTRDSRYLLGHEERGRDLFNKPLLVLLLPYGTNKRGVPIGALNRRMQTIKLCWIWTRTTRFHRRWGPARGRSGETRLFWSGEGACHTSSAWWPSHSTRRCLYSEVRRLACGSEGIYLHGMSGAGTLNASTVSTFAVMQQ